MPLSSRAVRRNTRASSIRSFAVHGRAPTSDWCARTTAVTRVNGESVRARSCLVRAYRPLVRADSTSMLLRSASQHADIVVMRARVGWSFACSASVHARIAFPDARIRSPRAHRPLRRSYGPLLRVHNGSPRARTESVDVCKTYERARSSLSRAHSAFLRARGELAFARKMSRVSGGEKSTVRYADLAARNESPAARKEFLLADTP